MPEYNRFGLSRNIPAHIKRQVRRECGFGCIFCGSTLIHYEHIIPEFKDAEIHDPACMALLCPKHHDLVTKGMIPKAQVIEKRNMPESLRQGFSSEQHPYFRGIPSLHLGGGITHEGVPFPLRVSGIDIISFHADREDGLTSISMCLSDLQGKNMLRVVDNEWIVDSGMWDFTQVGNAYKIRSNDGESYLHLKFLPPHEIIIEKAKVFANGIPFIIDGQSVLTSGFRFSGVSFKNVGTINWGSK